MNARCLFACAAAGLILISGGCGRNQQHSADAATATAVSSPPQMLAPHSMRDVAHKEAARPTVRPPKFQVFKENTSLGVAFVVPINTTDEQLKSLLWLFRDKVHSGDFVDLGLKSPEWGQSGKGGVFQVYRGPKCANEMYEMNGPCGHEPHTAAYFQWGLRQDLNRDAGYIQRMDGSEDLIFGYLD